MNKRVSRLYNERAKLRQKSEKTGNTELQMIKQNGRVTDALIVTKSLIHYRYYETLICSSDEDGRIVVFNSGGWHTKTTKERINAICSLLGLNRQLLIKKGAFVWNDGKDFKDYETFTY